MQDTNILEKFLVVCKTSSYSARYSFKAQISLLRMSRNSGLDPKTSLVIDELIHSITQEYGTTTIINTHDMNSVMGIGEHILYIYEGHREWEGTKDEVMTADNERLNSFIFASDLFRRIKESNT